jgi:radical SAM superfamily enzyme YgiQ (UPF0313 family)
VDWIERNRLQCATFHILTPYPGTALYRRMIEQRRMTTDDWDLYDTRHAVFRPALMSAAELERGYRWAYGEFYRWKSIVRGAWAHARLRQGSGGLDDLVAGLRHLAYAAGWKKFEPLWDFVIRARRAGTMLPILEAILSEFGRCSPERPRVAAEALLNSRVNGMVMK